MYKPDLSWGTIVCILLGLPTEDECAIQLTKENYVFELVGDCQEAFDLVKKALLGPEIKVYPTDDVDFILDVDTSLVMSGAVLSQIQDGVDHIIPYCSRILSNQKHNHCVTDNKILAMRFLMDTLTNYLL